jgi:opine dehydrogenase
MAEDQMVKFDIKKAHVICVVGSGNIAHSLVGMLGNKANIEINILSTSNQRWNEISVYKNNILISKGMVNIVTNDVSKIIPQSDIIFFTVPVFAREKLLKKISPFVSTNTLIGSFPGTSGFDLLAQKHIVNKSINIFSSQRAPYISRIIEKGKCVNSTPKDSINIAVKNDSVMVKNLLSELLSMKINILDNFLEVNLSNSNPILHSARLYRLFKDYEPINVVYPREILFYEDWDNLSSEILLNADREFMGLVSKLNLKNIKSLKEHYQVGSEEQMTEKIISIEAFHGIKTPMVKVTNGFIPDIYSRYFMEDVLYGLNFINNYAQKLDMEVSTIKTICNWGKKLCMVNGKDLKSEE